MVSGSLRWTNAKSTSRSMPSSADEHSGVGCVPERAALGAVGQPTVRRPRDVGSPTTHLGDELLVAGDHHRRSTGVADTIEQRRRHRAFLGRRRPAAPIDPGVVAVHAGDRRVGAGDECCVVRVGDRNGQRHRPHRSSASRRRLLPQVRGEARADVTVRHRVDHDHHDAESPGELGHADSVGGGRCRHGPVVATSCVDELDRWHPRDPVAAGGERSTLVVWQARDRPRPRGADGAGRRGRCGVPQPRTRTRRPIPEYVAWLRPQPPSGCCGIRSPICTHRRSTSSHPVLTDIVDRVVAGSRLIVHCAAGIGRAGTDCGRGAGVVVGAARRGDRPRAPSPAGCRTRGGFTARSRPPIAPTAGNRQRLTFVRAPSRPTRGAGVRPRAVRR